MSFYTKVKEIIHSEYDWDDISSGNIAKAITDIHNKQLANIKHLNANEVEHIIGSINTNQEKVHAICNLAIPDIDRDKIIEVLERLAFNHVKYYIQSFQGYSDINCSIVAEDLIKQIADQIIKAIRGEE